MSTTSSPHTISDAEEEFDDGVHVDAEHNFTRLTNLVRSQYFEYLRKVLDQNYMEWLKAQNSYNEKNVEAEQLDECAIRLEERAVKCCMVVQLYRKAMLRIIAGIRRDTVHGRLMAKLKHEDRNQIEREPVSDSDVILTKLNEHCLGGSYTPPRPIDIKLTECPELPTDDQNFLTYCTESVSIDHEIPNLNYRNIDASNLKYVHHAELQFDENIATVPFEERAISSQIELNLSNRTEDAEIHQNGSNNSLQNAHQDSTAPHNDGLTEMQYEFLTLQEKIQHFQEILDDKENKRTTHKRKRSPLPIVERKNHRKLSTPVQPLSPVSTSSSSEEEEEQPNSRTMIGDSIDKDLENLFGEDAKNESDDIFGDGSYNPHTDLILRQIENSELPDIPTKFPLNKSKAKEKKTKSYKLKALITDMRDSLWPCEHYKWKQTLRETLGHQMAEVDVRRHEQIRCRFRQLFGEDSEDEFEPYSPTLELDDVLTSSCMKRIAPTIVKFLMIPMKNGLIGSRGLFKKLAKKLAYNIVLENQYADEIYIKERVELVFLFKRRIQSIADLDIT